MIGSDTHCADCGTPMKSCVIPGHCGCVHLKEMRKAMEETLSSRPAAEIQREQEAERRIAEESKEMRKANSLQVGGSHYKREDGGEEHWDRVARLRLDYYQAQITKYVERAKLKNGVQDLKKAQHFLQKYLELIAEGKVEGYESSGGVAAMMQKPGVPDPEVKNESK